MVNSHPRRPLLVAFVVFLLAAVAAATLIWHSDQRERQERRARVSNLAGVRAASIQRNIEHDLSASYALAALVRQGRGTVPDFDAVAGQLLPFYPGVSELALAPGGVIRNVAPLASNERALGHDLLQDPAQNKEAFLARDTGKLTLAGPLNLVQGGLGVIGRLPVFLDDDQGKPRFWGFTLVMMRFPEALEAVDLPQLTGLGFAYELWRTHPDSGQKQIIAASAPAALIEPVGSTLQVSNATWTLSVAPLGGWGDPVKLAFKVALGLLVSLLLAYLAKLLLELRAHREELEALVAERTAEVRAREADLNHAQSIARVGSWSLDLATKRMRGSAEAMRIFGVGENVPINYRAFLERVHPDDRAAVDLASRASLKGERYDIEYRILAGAATRWVHGSAELSFDADGNVSAALGTIQDITERKRSEEALRASELRYREMFEANPHPMWVWDLQTLMFLAVNDAAVAHYGYSRDEFLAMMITDIRPPEDVPRLLQRVAQVQKHSDRGAGLWRHRKKDGVLIDVEIVSHTLVFDGRRAQMVLANDVTDRLGAERALRESEERFRSLTEMSSDFYWESDAGHRLTQLITGNKEDPALVLPQGSPLGKPRWEVPYLTPDAAGWEAHRARLDSHRPFRDFGYSRLATDGAARHIEISGDPVFDATGAFQGYRGVGRDITERKRAERALAESEARFRSLTEMSSDFYWESDAEHRLRARASANRKLSTVSVFQRGAQIGERRWEIPYLTPDAAGWQAHRAVLDAHRPFRDFQLSRLGTDGTERHISISGDPVFDASGAFQGYRGVGTDITERKRAERALKESEQRLRLALNSAAMAAWEWEIGPDVLTWSEHPGWLVGPEPAGGYADYRELVHADDRAGFLDAGRQAVARRAPYHAVFRIRRTDGAVRWIEAQGVFLDREGTEHGERIIGVSQDITERRRNEAELRRLNEELEQRVAERTHALKVANNELEAFSYSVSHDLRAPLRAIHGFSRLVLDKYAAGQIDEQGRDMLRRINTGADQMGRLIDDLLRLSRISRQAMQVGPVDLSVLAREVIEELQAGEPERRVEWVVAPQVAATGDAGLLRVVLQNLIGNAWKYSSRRDDARIEFGVAEKDGGPVYFVRDNGVGFDMAHAKKLFGAFQRLHAEAEFPGSGIGLATVARILHRHGGEAWADARVGEGATFYFTLG